MNSANGACKSQICYVVRSNALKSLFALSVPDNLILHYLQSQSILHCPNHINSEHNLQLSTSASKMRTKYKLQTAAAGSYVGQDVNCTALVRCHDRGCCIKRRIEEGRPVPPCPEALVPLCRAICCTLTISSSVLC